MNDERIYEILSTILSDVLGQQTPILSSSTMPSDVPGWDSFVTVNLVVEIERRFEFKMEAGDFRMLRSVGDFVAVIARAVGAAGGSPPETDSRRAGAV
jgi:acyl carrier protein